MKRRYAEGTTVSVDASRGELTGLLTRYGCQRMAWATEPEADTLQFELGDHSYRFVIRRPTPKEIWQEWKAEGRTARQLKYLPTDAQVAAEWRRRWRAHVLLLKAKLEFVASGNTTLEREFMPALVTASGRTLGDWLESDAGVKLLGAGS